MADEGWVPLVWPVPSSKIITQRFGENEGHHRELGWTIGHAGVDIRTRTAAFPNGIGTPVVAARGGTVRYAAPHVYPDGTPTGYGMTIILAHPDRSYTLYAHLSRAQVARGDTVHAGQPIGEGGATGNVTGPQLHFELWRAPFESPGAWGRVDPAPYFEELIVSADQPGDVAGSEARDGRIRTVHNEEDPICACRPFLPEQ